MALQFLSMCVCFFVARGREAYDEKTAAAYVWVTHIGYLQPDVVNTWTCGLPCDTVKDMHNARAVHSDLLYKGRLFMSHAVVAEYGSSDCIVVFRGTQNALDLVGDDFNTYRKRPYASCPDCFVHKGFYISWQALEFKLTQELLSMGCEKKPLRLVGHSLGGAIAMVAAFDMVLSYTLRHVYTFGQPRSGNQVWLDAFQNRSIDYFRVTEYKDPIPHLPTHIPGGYVHLGPEVFYYATQMGAYRICPSGEDTSCSNQFYSAECLAFHKCCHCSYLGLNPCRSAQSYGYKPKCVQGEPTDASLVIM